MEWAHGQDLRVVTLHAEGVVTEPLWPFWAGVGLDASVEDGIILWGPRAKEIFVRLGREADRIFVCGNPRFDKYFRPLPTKEEFCQREGWDPHRPIVFYAASLLWVRGEDYDSRDWSFVPNASDALPRIIEQRYVTNEAFFGLAESHPEVNFVLKPHPGDGRPQEFVDEVRRRRLPNLRYFHNEVDIADLLPVCDLFLHWNSTSSTEAWFLGKPTLSLQFDPSLDFFLSDFIRGSEILRSEAELRARVRRYLAGGQTPPEILRERDRFLRAWYGTVDGRAVERCAAALEAVYQRQPPRPRTRRTWSEWKSNAIFLAKAVLGRPPHARLAPFLPPYPDIPTPEDYARWESKARAHREARPVGRRRADAPVRSGRAPAGPRGRGR